MSTGPVTVLVPEEIIPEPSAAPAEAEADDLLAAWTAAWHPGLLASTMSLPSWTGVDHVDPTALTGTVIVPACCDHRVTPAPSQADGCRWISGIRGVDRIIAAAAGRTAADPSPLAGAEFAEDFRALGLAVLLSDLLARRMRSALDLTEGGFAAAAVAAATAAVAGRGPEVRDRLQECFGCLEAARAHYYPVEVWLLDLVLLTGAAKGSAAGRGLACELADTAAFGLVAAGEELEALAATDPALLDRLRERIADGSVSPCGGRDRDTPLGPLSPEQILASFDRGLAAWRTLVGAEPRVHAQYGGGSSFLLPRILADLGFSGAIWSRFDGTPLPDMGTGLVRWSGPGAAAIDTVAARPLDARFATTILELPARIGDAMDHDHVAVIGLARHAGGGGPWHRLLRRAADWSAALGTFLAPEEFFRRVGGSGREVRLGADAFPSEPGAGSGAASDRPHELDEEARRIVADAERRVTLFVASGPTDGPLGRSAAASGGAGDRGRAGGFFGRWRPAGRGERRLDHVLDNGLVRLEVHPGGGGLLAVRRGGDRTNRLSQRLSLRRPADAGGPDDAAERDAYGRMAADAIGRTAVDSRDAIESRGRIVAADGLVLGRFRQVVSLAAAEPLALLEVEVTPVPGAAGETTPVCRFAWHENSDVDIRRSVHGLAVATRRTRFSADHFIELTGGGWSRSASASVVILTAGPRRHELSLPHVLDTLLPADTPCRLAVGLDLERPWDAAFALRAGVAAGRLPVVGPANVRVAVEQVAAAGDRGLRARVGLIESAGVGGEVRLACVGPVRRATAVDARGRARTDADVATEGRTVVVFLEPYDWLRLDLECDG